MCGLTGKLTVEVGSSIFSPRFSHSVCSPCLTPLVWSFLASIFAVLCPIFVFPCPVHLGSNSIFLALTLSSARTVTPQGPLTSLSPPVHSLSIPVKQFNYANENSAESLGEGWWREEQCREVLDRHYARNIHTSYIEKSPPRLFYFFPPKMKKNLKVCSFIFFYTLLLSASCSKNIF